MYYGKDVYSVFTVFDKVRNYHERDNIKAGLYYVESDNYKPLRGNGGGVNGEPGAQRLLLLNNADAKPNRLESVVGFAAAPVRRATPNRVRPPCAAA